MILLLACVTTKTQHLDRLGQLSEFEQGNNTNSEQESNTDSHSARNKAHVAQQSATELGEEAPHGKEQSTQQKNKPSSDPTKTQPGQSGRPPHITRVFRRR